MSAVITSEFAAKRFRGRMMAGVMAMQGFGSITASIVSLCVTTAFKKSLLNDPDHSAVDFLWRLIIGLGMVPGMFALWSRLTIPESPRFTLDVERNLEQAAANAEFVQNGALATPSFPCYFWLTISLGKFDRLEEHRPSSRVDVPIASRRDFRKYFSDWSNLKVLVGCAWSWFALDFAFYGLGLNPSIIFNAIGFGQSRSTDPNQHMYEGFFNTSVGNIMWVPSTFFIGRTKANLLETACP